MAIEITTGGVTKTFRYFPSDAFYVDTSGNVNTNGNGRQVREAWFDGVKYYPSGKSDVSGIVLLCRENQAPPMDPEVECYPNVRMCARYATQSPAQSYYYPSLYLPSRLVLPACETIGTRAFYPGVERDGSFDIELPACKTIEAAAFGESKITSIELPVCEDIGNDAFYACPLLESIELPMCEKLNDNVFYGCNSLASVNLPVCKSIGIFSLAFCAIESITLPVCELVDQNAFWGCASLVSAYMPQCMEVKGLAFYQCSSLQSITVKSGCNVWTGAVPSTCQIIYV